MIRAALARLSPAGEAARLSVLIFHRVLAQRDPLFPGEIVSTEFDDICRWVRRWFNVLPLDEAVTRLRAGSLPARALSISFDDGYADNHDEALPVLQRHGLPATFFISTGFLHGGCMWNDVLIEAIRRTERQQLDLSFIDGLGSIAVDSIAARRAAIDALLGGFKYLAGDDRQALALQVAAHAGVAPPDLMMREAQVRAMHRAGMQIGAHTVSHPILARLDDAQALAEIRSSRQTLQALLDAPVPLFAYPNGKPEVDYSARTAALVREAGFDAALTTAWGVADRHADPFQLPRFTPWDRNRLRFALRLALNLRQRPTLVRAPAPAGLAHAA